MFTKSWNAAGAALVASSLFVLGSPPASAESVSSFPTSVTAQARYRLGDPVDVTFELHNPTGQDYSLLVWDTPLERGDRQVGSYVKLRRDNHDLAYQGRLATRKATPGARSYRTIHAGETVRETVDLTTAFAIAEPGTYTVTLDARSRDVVAGPAPSARANTQFTGQDLNAATATFELLPGGQPRLTTGAKLRQDNAKSGQKAKFRNMSGSHERDLRKAIPKANDLVEEAIEELEDDPRSDDYREWFGKWSERRYDRVTSVYEKIGDDADDATYDGDCDEDDDVLAWMDLDNPNYIWICEGYWDLPLTGEYSMAGVLVHEESHFSENGGTDDIEYGPDESRELAEDHPDRAVNNADNYMFFVDEIH